jgi:hypothetical protein
MVHLEVGRKLPGGFIFDTELKREERQPSTLSCDFRSLRTHPDHWVQVNMCPWKDFQRPTHPGPDLESGKTTEELKTEN